MAKAKKSLGKLLESLGESSRFVTSASLTPVLPGLEVEGIGGIGCPVSAVDAKRLIAHASQAPYGRGEETIVDTKVRRVWQIEPSQLSFCNRAWDRQIAEIVEAVRKEFGIRAKVKAELYKLLVYEKGSFFSSHRDTEKTPGMFATLVVSLPSRHKGGTLVVRHDGQTKTMDFGGENAEFATQYVAFYADCQHEIRPVTSGYRICLIYNLSIAGKKQPSPPQNEAVIANVAQCLKEIFADASRPLDKIAIPFTHQYTEASFEPRQLKGSDRARADVLVRAAESLEYQCSLALLTHHQSGEADYSSWDYGGSRRWGYRRSYEDDEEQDDDDAFSASDDSRVKIGEIYEENLSLDCWLDADGRKVPYGEMSLDEGEVLDPKSKAGWAFRQEVHEATGNEGVSLDRWYRQAVVVVWPRDRFFKILANEGQASALPALEKMAGRGRKPMSLAECRSFAEQIISHWKPRQRVVDNKASHSLRMLKLLERIGTAGLVRIFLCVVFPKDFDGSEGEALRRLFDRFGWESHGAALRGFLVQQNPEDHKTSLAPIVAICDGLCRVPPALFDERRAVCVSLADELMRVIERWDRKPTATWYPRPEARAGVLESVVRVFSTLAATDHLDRFLTHLLKDRWHYDLHQVLIPELMAISKWASTVPAAQPAVARLLQHCLTELRSATAQPIEPPRDWARGAELACNCQDCRALSQFLRDPTQQVGRFPLRKERRQHLHGQINKHGCDVTHVTERKGSPQTLVCTKTQASYERRLTQYRVDKKLLAELEAMGASQRIGAVKRTSGRRGPVG